MIEILSEDDIAAFLIITKKDLESNSIEQLKILLHLLETLTNQGHRHYTDDYYRANFCS